MTTIRDSSRRAAPVAVIGIGNVLLGDDGFGPTVIGMLAAQWEVPGAVELIDAGTPGLDLAGQLCGRDSVILVDAVADESRGEEDDGLRFYRGEALQHMLALHPRVSEHDPALAEALAIAGLVGEGPRRVLLLGVVPRACEVGVGLSPPVEKAAVEAAEAIVMTLAGWGLPAQRRELATAPELWWATARAGDAVAAAVTRR